MADPVSRRLRTPVEMEMATSGSTSIFRKLRKMVPGNPTSATTAADGSARDSRPPPTIPTATPTTVSTSSQSTSRSRQPAGRHRRRSACPHVPSAFGRRARPVGVGG